MMANGEKRKNIAQKHELVHPKTGIMHNQQLVILTKLKSVSMKLTP